MPSFLDHENVGDGLWLATQLSRLAFPGAQAGINAAVNARQTGRVTSVFVPASQTSPSFYIGQVPDSTLVLINGAENQAQCRFLMGGYQGGPLASPLTN